VVVEPVNELLVLGPDPPFVLALLAPGKDRKEIVAAFYGRAFTSISALRHATPRLALRFEPRQHFQFMDR
jgi:hypothetical protein